MWQNLPTGIKIVVPVNLTIFGICHNRGHLCYTNTSCFFLAKVNKKIITSKENRHKTYFHFPLYCTRITIFLNSIQSLLSSTNKDVCLIFLKQEMNYITPFSTTIQRQKQGVICKIPGRWCHVRCQWYKSRGHWLSLLPLTRWGLLPSSPYFWYVALVLWLKVRYQTTITDKPNNWHVQFLAVFDSPNCNTLPAWYVSGLFRTSKTIRLNLLTCSVTRLDVLFRHSTFCYNVVCFRSHASSTPGMPPWDLFGGGLLSPTVWRLRRRFLSHRKPHTTDGCIRRLLLQA